MINKIFGSKVTVFSETTKLSGDFAMFHRAILQCFIGRFCKIILFSAQENAIEEKSNSKKLTDVGFLSWHSEEPYPFHVCRFQIRTVHGGRMHQTRQ